MTGCTATLVTATVEPCATPVPVKIAGMGTRVICDSDEALCDGTEHVTLHTLRCQNPADHDEDHRWDGSDSPFVYVDWSNAVPGATAHVDPPVTDAERQAAIRAARDYLDGTGTRGLAGAVESALEAAARVRPEVGDA